ncbi:MAG TPA: metalloregulator ArsR/SmtB family transcription factor [Phycisphaerae bacterium]|nr:metalloregulator ArsR/SmtB family transcription factor [Phycisphaerae bacterium]
MKFLNAEQYEARARVAKALAHPSRLRLLDAIKQKPMCVCELTDLMGADQSTVSKHLAILKNAGLVECHKEGLVTRYRVRCTCLDGFFGCIENVLRQNLKAQQAAVGATAASAGRRLPRRAGPSI